MKSKREILQSFKGKIVSIEIVEGNIYIYNMLPRSKYEIIEVGEDLFSAKNKRGKNETRYYSISHIINIDIHE